MARGHITKRYKDSWSIVLSLGYKIDPETGERKRDQRWVTVRGRKRDAEKKLAELLNQANNNELVEPYKITFGEWLDLWLETYKKPPLIRPTSYKTYERVIRCHLREKLGAIPLQQLDAIHIEKYYAESSLSQATLSQHHTIISSALKSARKKKYIKENVATLVDNKPRSRSVSEGAKEHCWDEDEARQFVATAKTFGPQPAAFYALFLDSGARRGEMCGLRWKNVELDECKVRILEQMLEAGPDPKWGPPKGRSRTIRISVETADLLRKHRTHQAEIKMKYQQHYHDHGLVFAKEQGDTTVVRKTLGNPIDANNISYREYEKIIRAAGVKKICLHGLRHTCATLLLKAGEHVKVVTERLGHTDVVITMNIYQHVLPDMQEDAAAKMGAILF